jgi:hypothetical protein
MIGINLAETVDFILPDDKEGTVFKLGVISSYVMGQLAEQGSTGNKVNMMFRVCQFGLKGWTNLSLPFITIKENVFGVDANIVPISTLEQIPMSAIGQIAMKILEINKVTGEERKN